MSIELDIVRDVSERLTRAGIPFMLTGSMAMNACAQPRMTRDVDVVINVGPEDAGRFRREGEFLNRASLRQAGKRSLVAAAAHVPAFLHDYAATRPGRRVIRWERFT